MPVRKNRSRCTRCGGGTWRTLKAHWSWCNLVAGRAQFGADA
jgi:hypothetical protein